MRFVRRCLLEPEGDESREVKSSASGVYKRSKAVNSCERRRGFEGKGRGSTHKSRQKKCMSVGAVYPEVPTLLLFPFGCCFSPPLQWFAVGC